MHGQLTDQHIGHGHTTLTGLRLRRYDDKATTAQLSERPRNPNDPRVQVDVCPAQRDQLNRVGLADLVQHIEARDPSDPALMKPSPHLIERAAQALGVEPDACTLIGDQTTDVQAARAIGAASIGYANKPGKADDLTAAGADAVIRHIDELTDAIRAN